LKAEGLTKVYGQARVVDKLSVALKPGEVFGFIGHNGAGKTTTINMMVGLLNPTGGRCTVRGADVIRSPLEAKRMIGYMPDGVNFYANLSARQNLRYMGRFYQIPDTDRKIGELLEYVGLTGVEKPAGKYFRGMRQRLGLALLLLNDPAVMFLDEPTNGLDPEGVLLFRKIVKEQSAAGKAIFMSSHILGEINNLCDTIGIITKGKLVAVGTIDEVRHAFGRQQSFKIKVKVAGSMPELRTDGIMSATYGSDGADIVASSDICDRISLELYEHRLPIRELHVVESPLEEVFMETVYGRA
jgi:ABC-2 type transport system ATP-binding protein